MTEPLSSAAVATATSAAAASAAAAGWPPGIVIAWAVLGGLVSVWLNRATDVALNTRWVLSAVGHVFVSSASGVALSSFAVSVAASPQAWSYLQMLAGVPQWSVAGVIAALIHRCAPLVWKLVSRKVDTAAGGPNA